MAPIRCDATLFTIGSWTLLRLPKSASAQLPSRGMTMVEGTINGARFARPPRTRREGQPLVQGRRHHARKPQVQTQATR